MIATCEAEQMVVPTMVFVVVVVELVGVELVEVGVGAGSEVEVVVEEWIQGLWAPSRLGCEGAWRRRFVWRGGDGCFLGGLEMLIVAEEKRREKEGSQPCHDFEETMEEKCTFQNRHSEAEVVGVALPASRLVVR